MRRDRRQLLALLGIWTLLFAWQWPASLSFFDEAGYVGSARLLLDGRLTPTLEDPGVWVDTGQRQAHWYPLPWSAALAPFIELQPRSAFLLPLLATLALTLAAAALLERRGVSPLLGAVMLAHPTVALLSRTLMADVALAACCLGLLLAWERGRAPWVALGSAALIVIKPVGLVLAVAMALGALLEHGAAARRCLGPAVAGGIVGGATIALANLATVGTLRYGYAFAHADQRVFSFAHLTTTAPVHLVSLLLLPPLLLLAALPLLRERRFSVLAPAGALLAMMALYFYVDRGRGWLETLVLSQRLVLPAICLLLPTWIELLARGAAALGRQASVSLRAGVALAALAACVAIGGAHRREAAPVVEARQQAEALAAETESGVLGLTTTAFEAGLLTALPVRWVNTATEPTEIVLCRPESFGCRIEGCEVAIELAGTQVLRCGDPR